MIISLFRTSGTDLTSNVSTGSLTCLPKSPEIRTTSQHQPVIYTTPSQVVIIMQIHSIAIVYVGGGCDEELEIISMKAFCLNPATSTLEVL